MLDQTWSGGARGNWWVCVYNDGGLSDGLYEVVLEVEGEVLINDAVYVGGTHPPIRFTLNNSSTTTAYYVFISPTEAQNWGQDDLGDTEVLPAGGSRVFDLPAGVYDLLVVDSQLNRLVEEYGLDLTADAGFTFPVDG